MQVYTDLHIHSPFAQGSSRELQLEQLALAAKRKGLHVIGAGDWTHPGRWSELRSKLMPAEDGLFRLRSDLELTLNKQLPPALTEQPLRFLLSTEVSTVYEQEHQVRKIHHLLFAPDFARAQRIRQSLERHGDLTLDGRPTLSLNSRDLLEITLESSPRCHLIPAHIWSPWNGLFGSTYGFETLDKCYQDLSEYIFALETGLSSIPSMSRQWSALDRLSLVSFSNTHAPSHLGREATAFNTSLQYDAFFDALQQQDALKTIEYFPEKGRYHLDGHRSCDIRCTPAQSRAHQMRCPVCHKPFTVGVLHRINQLKDRNQEDLSKDSHNQYQQLIALPEILSEVLEASTTSKRLRRHYHDLLERFGSELDILQKIPLEDIQHSQIPLLSEAIQRVRAGHLQITPGYDGEYGKVQIFREDESKATTLSLFSWSNAPEVEEALSASSHTDTPESQDGVTALPGHQLHLFPTPPPPTEEVIQTKTPEISTPGKQPPLLPKAEIQASAQESQLSLTSFFEKATQAQEKQSEATPTFPKLTQKQTALAPQLVPPPQAEDKTKKTPPLPSILPKPTPQTTHFPLPASQPSPKATKIPPAKQLLAGLNTEQRAAVLHQGSPILIAAGPGTGKTKTLVHRLAYQLATRRVMPQHAVFLTFSQEAASEVQELLLRVIGPVARRIFIGTFQRFCLRLLQDYRRSILAGSQSPEESTIPPPLPESLLGAFESLALLEDLALAQCVDSSPRTLRYHLDRISWAKQNLHSPDDVAREHPHLNQDFVHLFRSYQEHLNRQQRYDLDDLLFETVRHLRESTELCQQLQLQFRSFFIDEYQELNEAQYRLLRFIVSKFADLSVAGDPDQSVYSFRGANRHYFYQFERDFSLPDKQATRTAMWRNYRSPETVLEASYQLICKQHDPQRVQTLATQTGPLFIPLSTFADEEVEAQAITAQIADFVTQSGIAPPDAHEGLSDKAESPRPAPLETLRSEEHTYKVTGYRDIAILYRSSQQLPPLEQALSRAGIPYHLTWSGTMTSHSDIQLLLGFMRCTLHDQSPQFALSLVLQYWPGLTKPLHLMFRQFAHQQELGAIPSLLRLM